MMAKRHHETFWSAGNIHAFGEVVIWIIHVKLTKLYIENGCILLWQITP